MRFFDAPTPNVAWILGDQVLPAHVDPEAIALRWGDHHRTYDQLRTRALALAGAFVARGLRPGDRVATLLRNRGETFELYFACAYAGLTFCPINFRLVTAELRGILDDCSPSILITEPAQKDIADAASADLETPVLVLGDVDGGSDYDEMCQGKPIEGPLPSTDPHLVLYTSGTSGRPKGAMLAHGTIMWFALQQAALYPEIDRRTVMLLTAPTFNTGSINELSIPTFYVGGAVCLLPSGGWSAEAMAEHIDRWSVTHTLFFPSFIEPLLVADQASPLDMPTLRWALCGGEDGPTPLLMRFQHRWSHAAVWYGYGLTEGGGISILFDDAIEQHPGSVGRPYAGQIYRIADPEGSPVPQGEVGEVLTAGGALFSGYWHASALTAETLRDGWLWTGDLGYQDEDGYLHLAGRSKDMIISGGQNIFPAEVEAVLMEHAEILEATVIAVPDRRFGEAVCAVVVAKPGCALDEDAVITFVRERLASYKKPKYVRFRDALPRNQTNKVIKEQLRREYGDLEQPTAAAASSPPMTAKG
jgi:fatty-acyl-CoA synthase